VITNLATAITKSASKQTYYTIRFLVERTRLAISLSIIALALLYAHIKLLQKFRPVLIWFAQGIGSLNEVINWALVPLTALFCGVASCSVNPKMQLQLTAPA